METPTESSVPAAISPLQASVQFAAVRITILRASRDKRLPLQLTRARFCDSTMPRTDATLGYRLFVSGTPQVIAPTGAATPRTSAAAPNDPISFVLNFIVAISDCPLRIAPILTRAATCR